MSLRCEEVPGHADFRPLSSITGLRWQLRYASADNFVGRDLYSPLDCAWLHKDAAAALAKSAAWLAVSRPDLQLLLLDGLRPQRVQEALWEALQGTDLLGYLAPPERGSIHSFGMAVDVTLAHRHGGELDMGTPFDDLTRRSHTDTEDAMIAAGDLTSAQVAHRRLLRAAMQHGGWVGIRSEWWHFDCGNREQVRANYTRVL